jgi:hypothetical protein
MAHNLDTYAIRLIHHHGQLSRDYERPTIRKEYRRTLELALESLERELELDYKLTLPNGITIRD